MLRWIIHAMVFGDVALVWVLRAVVVATIACLLRHGFRRDAADVDVSTPSIGKHIPLDAERSRPAA
jgi:hypothetical protein